MILCTTMSDFRVSSFAPVYTPESRVLILGTMASPASLRSNFFYGHPQNAFWRILAELTGDDPGQTPDTKRAFLLRQHIALWDTLESCVREGSSDSAIHAEHPSDIPGLVRQCPALHAVFLNGGTALRFYKKYHAPQVHLPFFGLPSTSPANARGGFEAKLTAWRALAPYLT
ncbi:MAG: DNA-deoxyinosine glycosylase [Ethanoligenens sp.]